MADSIVTGIAAVAEHFGRSERQVRRWMRDGMPRLSQNRFDVLQISAWLDSRKGLRQPTGPGWVDPRQRGLGEAIEPGGKDYQEERLKKAKADLAEMEVRQRREELILRDDLSKEIVQRYTGLRQGLLVMKRSLPPVLMNCQTEREIEIILGEAFQDLLAAWSRPLPDRLGGVEVEKAVQEMTEGGANLEP